MIEKTSAGMNQGMINKLITVLETTLSKLSRYDEGSLIGSILSLTVFFISFNNIDYLFIINVITFHLFDIMVFYNISINDRFFSSENRDVTQDINLKNNRKLFKHFNI